MKIDYGIVECNCGEIREIEFLEVFKKKDMEYNPPLVRYKFFFKCMECGTLFTIDIEE